jgi:hypothetical protein
MTDDCINHTYIFILWTEANNEQEQLNPWELTFHSYKISATLISHTGELHVTFANLNFCIGEPAYD